MNLGKSIPYLLAAVFFIFFQSAASAFEVKKIDDNIYALVGPLEQRSPVNLGNNATFGVIITDEGVVLIDPGGSAQGAAQIEAAVAKLTHKPVTVVINSGGQDHRWMGNDYFKSKGARLIASADAVEDHQDRADIQLTILEALIGKDKLQGTVPVFADETFETELDLNIGGINIQIRHPGAAHTPGDSFVWLPGQRIVFSGDIVYLDRTLGVLDVSDSASWVESFNAMAALKPRIVVPGHGNPAAFSKAEAQTLRYLQNLRQKVGAVIEAGGDIKQATGVDQSEFKNLNNFEQLSRRNAQQVFIHMEFE